MQISRLPIDGAPSPKFGLSLLGGFELTGPDGVVELPSKKLAGLLAYLACNLRPQSREKLTALLWGSHFEAQAKQNLRQALFRLRKVLGQNTLESDGEVVSLNAASVSCDVRRFETLVREGSREALSAATDLYRGRLIDDVTVGEAGWNEWIAGERERLLELALGALVGLGEQELAAGRAEHALKAGQRAIALNDMREDAHRLVVQALAATGRKAEALTHYQDLVVLLKRELNTEPDGATRSLAAALRGTPSSGRSPAVGEIAKPALPEHDRPSAAVLPLAHTRGDHEQKVNTNTPEARSDAVSSVVAVRAGGLERRQLTILVCKMVDSTPLSARLDPEDMRDVIAAFHKVIADAVARFDGFVAQYQSDGAVVYFGYPEAHEYEAEQAVRAGLAILAAVGSLKVSSGIPLQARAGIATGVVVVGEQMGSADVVPAVAIGKTPDLAAQMQAVASPGEVVIAGSTRRLVGRMFDCRALGAHEVKGLPQPVEAWQVRGEAAGVSRFEARRVGALPPLVGRQEEMDLLRRRWNQAKLGEGRVLLLSGEPGIGKSRIAESLLAALEGEPHARMRYFCSPHHTNSPLYPFIAQLERTAGFEPGNSAAAKLDKLGALLKLTARNAPRDLALMADLLSMPTDSRYPVVEGSPEQKREMTLSALLHQLEGMAAQSPVLILFEDAHWIDPTSLDLLDRAIDCIAKLPVLMVVTFRPEFQPAWIGQPHVTMLPLNRLGRRDSADIIGGVAQGKTLPDVVVQQILAHTDGVPLFIEELTITLLESGHLRETADGYVLDGPLPSPAIPTTLQASLLARLDRLASVKDIAQIGAAIGREFSFRLIAAVSAMPKQELAAALRKVVAAELIFQRGAPPNATYRFKHALVQDAAYASLLRSRRSALHATIVKQLVGVSDTEVKPELLAHHCAEAGMAEEAVRHYLKASEQAVARSALTEAAVLLDKSLGKVAQLPTGPPRDRMELEVQSARGAVLIAVKGFAAAETGQVYARARDLWDRLDRPPEFLLRTARGRWSLHTNRSQLLEAQSVAEDLLEFGRAHGGDTAGLILGYFTRGLTHAYRGELQSARASLEEVIGLYDLAAHRQLFRYSGTDPYAIALASIGQVLLFLGYPDQALMRAEAAIRQARQLAHAPTVAQCLAFGAARASTLGDEAQLAHCEQELRTLTEEHGYAQWSALVPIFGGQLQLMRGEAKAAVTLIRQGLDARRATGVTLFNADFAIPLGEALEKDGKSGEALALLDEQIVFVEETGELWCAAGLHRLRGQLLLKGTVPDFAGAQAEFVKAIDVARGQSAKLWELRAAVSLARLWRDQGRHAEARDLLAPVYGWFTEGFDVPDLKNAKGLLNELA
ncbi:AAA family ATPase [Bradyrhizobium sediminis]|uniref:AAA family ATPase n=1 Tax=Bradyrhizobium sediminis TaxID=2840469 RepID=A0A975NKK2_9BRAD|nr:BTAD domain-containing putative transcriptional regulator [Bradyrhizobium sediminis]QWG16540.1 AAA family ATPase [Bradyrhizobium sediminis]